MLYKVKLKTASGLFLNGFFEAYSINELATIFNDQRCSIVKYDELPKKHAFKLPKWRIHDFLVFLKEWKVLGEGQIEMYEAFQIIRDTTSSSKISFFMIYLLYYLSLGFKTSDAFKKLNRCPVLFISMLEVAESSNSLPLILEKVCEYYESHHKIKEKVKTVSVYPRILLVICILVVLILNLFIIPSFKEMFQTFNTELPLVTHFVFGLSDYLSKNYLIIISLAILIFLLIFWLLKQKFFQRTKCIILSKIPIVKDYYLTGMMNNFLEMLTIMIFSNVPLLKSLKESSSIMENITFEEAVDQIIVSINNGDSLEKAIKKTHVFPKIFENIMEIGNKSGNIKGSLTYLNTYYKDKYLEKMAKISNYIEPFMIIVVALIVAFVLGAIFIPLLEIMGSAFK